MYADGAVGLAKPRRDGFASMQARFAGLPATQPTHARRVPCSGYQPLTSAGR